MRRIISKHEAKRKRRRNQIILGTILIFVMVGSVLGFALQGFNLGGTNTENDGSSNIEYNGFEFVSQNGLWVLGNFIFRNVPQQVEDIGFVSNNINNYQGRPLYIYSESEEAELEIHINIGNSVTRIQKACIEEKECSGDFPIKTCEDNFIIIKENNISNIMQQDNCVFIEGPLRDLTKLTDQFLFKILDIR